MYADFVREYPTKDLATLSLPEFMWLLQGLSKNSRFQKAWADKPKRLHDPDARAAVIAAARR